jgi:hypothetical protein
MLLILGIGLAIAILFGRFSSVGSAEIAGIMAASTILNVRAFWDFHDERWFFPLVAGWITIHLIGLFIFIIPLNLAGSKVFMILIPGEFVAFIATLLLVSRIWGKPD